MPNDLRHTSNDRSVPEDIAGTTMADSGTIVRTRRRPSRTRGKPTEIDKHVGQRIRQRRILLGMSQEALAKALELTFQQVQKYERGTNRVGAGRLFQLARVLQVPVAYFFDEIEGPDGAAPAQAAAAPNLEVLSDRRNLNLIKDFQSIPDDKVKRCVGELLRALAG